MHWLAQKAKPPIHSDRYAFGRMSCECPLLPFELGYNHSGGPTWKSNMHHEFHLISLQLMAWETYFFHYILKQQQQQRLIPLGGVDYMDQLPP